MTKFHFTGSLVSFNDFYHSSSIADPNTQDKIYFVGFFFFFSLFCFVFPQVKIILYVTRRE